MTEKLYDTDSFLTRFEAKVLSCETHGDEYFIELDRTAFFPESGGQSGDGGTIGEAEIYDVRYDAGKIVHVSKTPLTRGATVCGEIDFEERFRKMQNHTGEHIVSSIMHRRFGYNNVGFHLGKDEMTFDFDGEISKEQLKEVEDEANGIVFKNVAVKTYYPSAEELKNLEYRSKGELEGAVRIVEIEGVDICACCAPHVKSTGQIGIIKILGFMRYKGGIRIRMQCGFDALDDFRDRISREEEISHLLCVPQSETVNGVRELIEQNAAIKYNMTALKKELVSKYADEISPSNGNECVFKEGLDASDLRELCNLCAPKCRIFAAFSGNDKNGYLMIVASQKAALRSLSGKIAEACRGKCGGSDLMLSGKAAATKEEIKKFFTEI